MNKIKYIFDKLSIKENQILNLEIDIDYYILSLMGNINYGLPLNPLEKAIVSIINYKQEATKIEIGKYLGFEVSENPIEKFDIAHKYILDNVFQKLTEQYKHIVINESSCYELSDIGKLYFDRYLKFKIESGFEVEIFYIDELQSYNLYSLLSQFNTTKNPSVEKFDALDFIEAINFEEQIQKQRLDIVSFDIDNFKSITNCTLKRVNKATSKIPITVAIDCYKLIPISKVNIAKTEYDWFNNYLNTNQDTLQKIENALVFEFLNTTNQKLSSDLISIVEAKWDWSDLCNKSNLFIDNDFLERFKDKIDWKVLSANVNVGFTDEILTSNKDYWNWDALTLNNAITLNETLLDEFINHWNWYLISKSNRIPLNKIFLDKYKEKLFWPQLSENIHQNITDDLLFQFKDKWNWNEDRLEFLPTTIESIQKYQGFINFNKLIEKLELDVLCSEIFIEILSNQKQRIVPFSTESIPTNLEFIKNLDSLNLIQWVSKRWSTTETYTVYKWDGSEDRERTINHYNIGFFENKNIRWSSSLLIQFKDKLSESDEESLLLISKHFSKELVFEIYEIESLKDILNWQVLSVNESFSINENFINQFIDKIDFNILSSLPTFINDDNLISLYYERLNWIEVIKYRVSVLPSDLILKAIELISNTEYTIKFQNNNNFNQEYVRSLAEYLDWEVISNSSNSQLFRTTFLNEFAHKFNWDLVSANKKISIDRYKLEYNKLFWNWELLSENEDAIYTLDFNDLLWFKDKWNWIKISTLNKTLKYLDIVSKEKYKKEWRKIQNEGKNEIILENFNKFPEIWWWKILEHNPAIPFYPEILNQFSDSNIWAGIVRDSNRFGLDNANINTYRNKIHWPSLTASPRISIDIEFIRTHQNNIDWSILSKNKEVHNNFNIVNSFKENFIWKDIFETCDEDLDERVISLFVNKWYVPFINIDNLSEQIISNVNSSFNSKSYITNSKIRQWKSEYGITLSVFINELNSIPFYRKFGSEYLLTETKNNIEKINDLINENSTYFQKLNNNYVRVELKNTKVFFDDINGVALDEQQREAVIRDEDNNLVVAGAGSGKTMTIAGKVKYLIERKNINPDEILLITFTKKAKVEMSERIRNVITQNINVETFHSLGNHILGNVLGENRPNLPDENSNTGRGFLNDKFLELQKEPRYKEILENYFVYYLKPYKPLEEFKNQGEYILYVKENNLSFKSIEVETKGTVSLYKEVLKSQEEVEIANFLLLNGIEYEYEKEYPINTRSEVFAQYKPDFYLPKYDIYIEHFAFINEQGDFPSWFNTDLRGKPNYSESAHWKRNLHKQHNTVLIETYSYEKRNGVLKENLKEKLLAKGVEFKPLSEVEVWGIIEKYYTPELRKFSDLLQTFITLLKQSRQKTEDIQNKLLSLEPFEKNRIEKFLEIFKPIYQAYEENLKKANAIDFSDMINYAIDYTNKDKFKKDLKYIIVDEFQDTSINRAELLKALRKNNPECKLFCVGDDWQSIFRFAGSDITLFVNFEKHFGFTHFSKIETTYRFDNSIIELSGNFIQKNVKQLKKQLNPIKNTESNSYEIIETENEVEEVKRILSLIYEWNNKQSKSILLLGRYKSSFNELFKSSSFTKKHNDKIYFSETPKLDIEALTVHKSKGLGADYVIVLSCNKGKYGFPSELNDDPVLKLVLSESDSYPDGEERRLFYVAMTRTKNQLFLLTNPNSKSRFIKELDITKNESNQLVKCPDCIEGAYLVKRLNKKKSTEFMGCSNYPICTYTTAS